MVCELQAVKAAKPRKGVKTETLFTFVFVGAFVALFALPAASNLFAALGEKPALNSPASELSPELKELESERVILVAATKKANLIGLGAGICAGAAIGALVYTFTAMLITASKRREFRANFKRQIIEKIIKKHGLSYDKERGLGLDEFFTIYDCTVHQWSSEDLISGEIEGVHVKFSDFYAAKMVKKKNNTETAVLFRGVLFKADFNKKLSSITQIAHVNSRNLAIYGQPASMDDVRFEERFNVYTTDQIGARYVLTPALMERFCEICERFGCPVNAVFKDGQIFIAVETRRDDFEPQLGKSLTDEATLIAYESEIESFTQIVKELNLNRKIW